MDNTKRQHAMLLRLAATVVAGDLGVDQGLIDRLERLCDTGVACEADRAELRALLTQITRPEPERRASPPTPASLTRIGDTVPFP
jgi:hypothetical protein